MLHRFLLVSSAKRFTNAAMTAATVSLMAVTSAIATEVALTIPGSPLSRAAIAQTTRSDSIEDAVVYVQTERGRGSGVVIDSNGLIITNAHVVEAHVRFKSEFEATWLRLKSFHGAALNAWI